MKARKEIRYPGRANLWNVGEMNRIHAEFARRFPSLLKDMARPADSLGGGGRFRVTTLVPTMEEALLGSSAEDLQRWASVCRYNSEALGRYVAVLEAEVAEDRSEKRDAWRSFKHEALVAARRQLGPPRQWMREALDDAPMGAIRRLSGCLADYGKTLLGMEPKLCAGRN